MEYTVWKSNSDIYGYVEGNQVFYKNIRIEPHKKFTFFGKTYDFLIEVCADLPAPMITPQQCPLPYPVKSEPKPRSQACPPKRICPEWKSGSPEPRFCPLKKSWEKGGSENERVKESSGLETRGKTVLRQGGQGAVFAWFTPSHASRRRRDFCRTVPTYPTGFNLDNKLGNII